MYSFNLKIIVNDRLQIYVIYSLIRIKMKKIIVIFITFSGISTGFAQNTRGLNDADTTKQNTVAPLQPVKKDSLTEKETLSARVFPNPAKNKVEIEVKGFKPGNVQIQLIDKNGKLIRNEQRAVFNGNETIVFMFSESPGIYFLLVKQNEKSIKNKLVVQ